MIALTKNMRPQVDRIAIVLDGEVISAPVVNQVPLGKQFIDQRSATIPASHRPRQRADEPAGKPAQDRCDERRFPPLWVQPWCSKVCSPARSRCCSPSLFVLIYYRVAGFIAIIGLIVNTVMLFGVMAMFGFTFSLPGIAGMVLTIGMAVDANVLIYERLREEMRCRANP